MDTTILAVAISELPGVADKTVGVLLQRLATSCLEPMAIFGMSAENLVSQFGISLRAAESICRVETKLIAAAENAVREARRSGVEIMTILDAAYPVRALERLEAPPSIIYLYGNSELLNQPLVAVANSNNASDAALAATDVRLQQFIENGWIPITGHNRIAYQRAGLVSARFGKGACYVLDRGLLAAFDGDLKRNLFASANIWSSQFDVRDNLAMSVWPMNAHGRGNYNRRRDDIIFGLADEILKGEIQAGGGMQSQCNRAMKRGTRIIDVMETVHVPTKFS